MKTKFMYRGGVALLLLLFTSFNLNAQSDADKKKARGEKFLNFFKGPTATSYKGKRAIGTLPENADFYVGIIALTQDSSVPLEKSENRNMPRTVTCRLNRFNGVSDAYIEYKLVPPYAGAMIATELRVTCDGNTIYVEALDTDWIYSDNSWEKVNGKVTVRMSSDGKSLMELRAYAQDDLEKRLMAFFEAENYPKVKAEVAKNPRTWKWLKQTCKNDLQVERLLQDFGVLNRELVIPCVFRSVDRNEDNSYRYKAQLTVVSGYDVVGSIVVYTNSSSPYIDYNRDEPVDIVATITDFDSEKNGFRFTAKGR